MPKITSNFSIFMCYIIKWSWEEMWWNSQKEKHNLIVGRKKKTNLSKIKWTKKNQTFSGFSDLK